MPAHYPTTWSFLNYTGDRIELRNVGSDTREVRGQLQAHDSATLRVSGKRGEIYVADTVWSRGVRGARTDFITVYDAQSFNAIGEIVLPGTKRALRLDAAPLRAAFLARVAASSRAASVP